MKRSRLTELAQLAYDTHKVDCPWMPDWDKLPNEAKDTYRRIVVVILLSQRDMSND